MTHPHDVIVVLGAALTADGRDLGPALAERVVAGADAFHRGLAPWLLVTGACEAELMKARALALGVPEGAILTEATALTTRHNALASAAIMRDRGLRRALIVTQPFHRRRAVAAFRKAGVSAEAYLFASRGSPLRLQVRELGALAIYALRGWLSL